MPITIDELLPGSQSTWIEWTNPLQGDVDISRNVVIRIKFSRILDFSSFSDSHIRLASLTNGTDIDDAFNVIKTSDYDDIALVLELHLSRALDPETQYMLLIDGLYDAIGTAQDGPHSLTFTTNASSIEFESDVSDEKAFPAVDQTIANSSIETYVIEGAGVHSVYMDPTDGSYNVDPSTAAITVTFSPADLTVAHAIVRRRVISVQEISWTSVAQKDMEEGLLVIPLPQVSAGVYVEPGYEYEVTVKTGDETSIMYFLGELVPMFTSVQSVITQNPYFTSYDVAKMIYLASVHIIDINPQMSSTPTKAASDYALYYTLWQLSLTGGTAASITLGNLTVKSGTGAADLLAKWERLMLQAESRIVRSSPKVLVKGSGVVSPHSARDWDATGTTKRRIGTTA